MVEISHTRSVHRPTLRAAPCPPRPARSPAREHASPHPRPAPAIQPHTPGLQGGTRAPAATPTHLLIA